MEITGNWLLCDFDEGEGLIKGAHLPECDTACWVPVSVPGDVHTALIAAGRVEDPFVGQNIEKCEWVERREWWYRAEFQAPEAALDDRCDLVFEGLDTYATVYLNGEELAQTDNMFIRHRVDATRAMRPGRNVLAVRFDSTVATVERRDASPFWAAFYPPRVWVRKAGMNFGWDWGPRLVTCGIWRPVRLEIVRRARIESHYVRTHAIAPQHAVILVGAEVELLPTVVEDGLRLRATLVHEGKVLTGEARLAGRRAEIRLLVENPRLWWPNGTGDQPLHPVTVELLADDEVLDRVEDRVGIRTVSLLQEPDPDGLGSSFTIVVNGMRIFARGADWIPADNFIGSIPPQRYQALVGMASEANMNMLRVWGGGVYEHEAFYRACDERGVMVWQDFMFSCAAYPDHDESFVANVRREAETVVKRLRNHACIALWCGNNENDWIDDMTRGDDPAKPFYGRRIYHEVLPAVCAGLDPSRPYWPSSPYGGSDHNSEREGDRHNWQVWAGQKYPHVFGEPYGADTSEANVSFRNYALDLCRFCSEFGIHASPVLRTLTTRTGNLEYDSPEFLYRIKDFDVERKARMMRAHIGEPTSLEQYRVFSMLVQAEGLRFAIEHYRRRMHDCAGSLFWQLNDCWPGISWSVIDYDLNPKAGWYYAKRAYAPLALSAKIEEETLHLYVVNDRREDEAVTARLLTVDTREGIVGERTVTGVASANAATVLTQFRLGELGLDDPTRRFLVLREAAGKAPEHAIFLAELKDTVLAPATLSLGVQPTECGADITVASDVPAHFVAVDIDLPGAVLSDNYVTLLPGEERTLSARATRPITSDLVTVLCLNNMMPGRG